MKPISICSKLGAAYKELQGMLMLTTVWLRIFRPLRDFGNVCIMRRGRLLASSTGNLGWVGKLGEVSGNHQSEMNGVSQFNEELRFGAHLHWATWVGGEFNTGEMAHASTSIPRENYPDPCPSRSYPEVSQFSFSLYISGTF